MPNSFGQPGRHAARPGPGHSGAVGASTDTHIPPLCRAAHDLLERPRRSERGVGRAARQWAGWGCEGGGTTGGSRRFTRHRTDASHVGRRGRAPRRDARHAGAQRERVRHRGAVHARRRHRAAAPRRERVERRQPVPRKLSPSPSTLKRRALSKRSQPQLACDVDATRADVASPLVHVPSRTFTCSQTRPDFTLPHGSHLQLLPVLFRLHLAAWPLRPARVGTLSPHASDACVSPFPCSFPPLQSCVHGRDLPLRGGSPSLPVSKRTGRADASSRPQPAPRRRPCWSISWHEVPPHPPPAGSPAGTTCP